jgi:hypothetical protein
LGSQKTLLPQGSALPLRRAQKMFSGNSDQCFRSGLYEAVLWIQTILNRIRIRPLKKPDPDQDPEKNADPDPALCKILYIHTFGNKKFLLKNGLKDLLMNRKVPVSIDELKFIHHTFFHSKGNQ